MHGSQRNYKTEKTVDIVKVKLNSHGIFSTITEGLNKKYKIDLSELGTNTFYYNVENINKANYFMFFGCNSNKDINFIIATFKGQAHKVIIPQQEYFIAYCTIDNDVNEKYPDNGIEAYYKSGSTEKH